MICPHCKDGVELKTKTDRETRMMSNYWWCDDCSKTVDPQPDEATMQEMIARQFADMQRAMYADWSKARFGTKALDKIQFRELSPMPIKTPKLPSLIRGIEFDDVIVDEVIDDV